MGSNACVSPIIMYYSTKLNYASGKFSLVSHKSPYADFGREQILPCGRCINCRLERSRQWAVRCVHEASMNLENSFITLTYRPEDLVIGTKGKPTLRPRDLMLFWKRLRKEYGDGIRYFACGEYGERTNRPHYHACVFGFDFPDKELCGSEGDYKYYSSASLNKLWGHGHCIIGDVTFESAAYVARYINGKKLGKEAVYYEKEGIVPEFVRMSRRPGIGSSWLDKFGKDVYPNDYVVTRDGVKMKPPRYYDKKLALDKANVMEHIKGRRFSSMERRLNDDEFKKSRHYARRMVKLAKIRNLHRNLD